MHGDLPTRPDERVLDGGLVLRAATAADIEAIVALQIAAFGAQDEPGVRGYLTGPGHRPENWAVVLDGGHLVSACARLPLTLSYDGLHLPAGQIEYVVTDPAYRRRGLVRAMFDWHHEHADAAGQLVQFVGGIPYLYRRFGYGYGVSYPDLFVFDRGALEPDPTVTVRPAGTHDIGGLLDLDAARPTHLVRVARDETSWRCWLTMTEHSMAMAERQRAAGQGGIAATDRLGPEQLFVAERDGVVSGWSSLTVDLDEGRLFFAPAVTTDARVTDTLLAHALDRAGTDLVVVAHDTPGTAHGARVREVGQPVPFGLGLYVRIGNPVALLDALRPVLSERLAASPRYAERSGTVTISLYNSGLALDYGAGSVTAVRAVPGIEDPFDTQDCGVAPDWLPALVFGRWGARELEDRVDDVTLGRHAGLLEVLFPRRPADLVADL